MNNKNIFIPKYILIYNSSEILNNEKKILLSDSFSINEYIKFSIPIENKNNYKLLKNEKNEELGKLIIIIKKRPKSTPRIKTKINNNFNNINPIKEEKKITIKI